MAAPNWVIILLLAPYLILHKLNLGTPLATTQESVECPRELNCLSSLLYKDSPPASCS
jgi:hypothetical protein